MKRFTKDDFARARVGLFTHYTYATYAEDKGTDYEQKIYLKDGKLLQEYSEKGAAPQPDEALEIGETDVFEASFVSDTVLRVETDKGTSYVDTEI